MSSGGERRVSGDVQARPIVYCLVPAELAPKLHDGLRRHFADDAGVEVVVERRTGERRSGDDRRRPEAELPPARDRRRAPGDRRVGERRAAQVPIEAPPLPRRARRYAEQLSFVERLEPSTQEAEDVDTARVVARVQGGDPDAYAVLYSRYFDRVYAYLRVLLDDWHEAEDATQQVFMGLLETIHAYERRSQPFRAWLFRVVRNHAISHMRRQGRVVPTDPAALDRRRDQPGDDSERLEVLDWIGDRDLLLFIERLPLPQRQVLFLRYVLDMTDRQVATVLGRSRDDVRALQSRAVRLLRARLAAIGREPRTPRHGRERMERLRKQAFVLRERRFSLWR